MNRRKNRIKAVANKRSKAIYANRHPFEPGSLNGEICIRRGPGGQCHQIENHLVHRYDAMKKVVLKWPEQKKEQSSEKLPF
jgi:hypothetical protein